MRRASCMSLRMMVTRFAWIAHRLVSVPTTEQTRGTSRSERVRVSDRDMHGDRARSELRHNNAGCVCTRPRGEWRLTLEQRHQRRLARLLQGQQRRHLEAELLPDRRELVRDLAHQPGEWQPANEQVGRPLVLPNLHEGARARTEAMLATLLRLSWTSEKNRHREGQRRELACTASSSRFAGWCLLLVVFRCVV